MTTINDFWDLDLGSVRPVTVLGKGPSFERYGGRLGDELIVGINQVCAKTPVDICIASHVEPLEEVREVLPSLRAVLVPYFPLYGWNGSHDKRFDEHEVLKSLKNVWCYNPFWSADRITPSVSPIIQSFGTTGHHIVQLLAGRDFKDFSLFGIDGGRKRYGKKYYADGFTHDSKEYFLQGKIPADFDEFWAYYFQMRRKHGLTLRFM